MNILFFKACQEEEIVVFIDQLLDTENPLHCIKLQHRNKLVRLFLSWNSNYAWKWCLLRCRQMEIRIIQAVRACKTALASFSIWLMATLWHHWTGGTDHRLFGSCLPNPAKVGHERIWGSESSEGWIRAIELLRDYKLRHVTNVGSSLVCTISFSLGR